ncbi:aminotransferase class I/II-fold pyridoxal phosphate-dependent enzyme [Marinomonas sp. C2222]|uniref:Aminotransferase n=1 Tax=Marinomonas sargassi TaxID=2984494 RepID=A0ABT2YPS3_9GAMM|nr:aminotransferase class I/II-fold pyridoxal phosphate-dependent enzyme [Marinomonas sargassi]MCV2401886.1 aminotransferase class I/II-fold pyridoxal phosphate-dependent enzyme [Marinomonas sargassi]
MSARIVSPLLELTPPKHGGDLAHWQREVGDSALNWLDLSSACNREPWPVPPISSEYWMELPDQEALFLSAQTYYGERPTAIGAGTQQIIEALPLCLANSILSSGRVFVPRIGYQEHAYVWQKWGYELAYYDVLEDLLDADWAVAVLIQPNNPTGRWASDKTLQKLLKLVQEHKRFLVVDEAFIDSCAERSLIPTLSEESKVVGKWPEQVFVLRSVGKFFGLAGARVGFVFCADKWQSSLQNLMGPWPVSTPSLHMVSLALEDKGWQESALVSLQKRRVFFEERVMPKLNTIFDSQENVINDLFITWQLESADYAAQVFDMLHLVGVHVRLGTDWIRVALPAMHEMESLDKALIRLLKGAGGRDLA